MSGPAWKSVCAARRRTVNRSSPSSPIAASICPTVGAVAGGVGTCAILHAAGTATPAPVSPTAASAAPTAPQLEFFEKRVRPLLADQCYKCHSTAASKTKGGLSVDSRDALLKGGDSGPAVVPGD